MLMKGRNVTAPNDELQPLEIAQFHRMITQPPSDLRDYINMLRQVKQIDEKAYSQKKRNLPYVICGRFQPPKRHSNHFAFTSCFIVDIDHIAQSETNPEQLRQKFQTDSRVSLLFTSPGQDGLKILFTLAKPISDKAIYSIFYKNFVKSLAEEFNLQNLIDTRVHDVARACFLSYDPDAWFNPAAEPINPDLFLSQGGDAQIDEELAAIKKELEITRMEEKQKETNIINDEAWARIKEILLQRKPKSKPEVYVPEPLKNLEEKLGPFLQNLGIRIVSSEKIQYGKKIRLASSQPLFAELNVYFGKRGFTVVQVTKHDTHTEFTDDCKKLIEGWIEDFYDQ
ncbi:MAG: CRISPR-associated primase-polymerase type B [Bacteroidales bacterium]